MLPTPILDTLRRPLRDLRISVTDRCNFRCGYCMPKEVFGKDFRFLPKPELLDFEEITRLARIFAELGVEKIRLTGGEPLLRHDLENLIAMLRAIHGVKEIALTTNGSLLKAKARALREAGLSRITVSLDSLDPGVFAAMNDVDFPVGRVLEGIDEARKAGFSPIKINVVVKRGLNDGGVVQMAERFRHQDYVVRFIEYMDVGATNGWKLRDVVPAGEILEMLSKQRTLIPLESQSSGEVARRFRYENGPGEIGFITSVTRPFCADCSRARLSSVGVLYSCLFATGGRDLKALLRSGASDSAVRNAVQAVWTHRDDRYSELRQEEQSSPQRVEMSHIGG